MLQKIIQVGNSYAVTIPKSIIEAYGVAKEKFVNLYEEPKKKRVVISFVTEDSTDEIVDTEVYMVAKKLLKRYLPAFKELAKK
ncbi:hypothetical protein HYS96_04210 [Candidatus Daviesbacteria bacterium]|nr:hypothetical protein [Candidatus Daviesbacteria bacterium]